MNFTKEDINDIVEKYNKSKFLAEKHKNGTLSTFHIGMAFAYEELLEKFGFNYTDVRSGKFADEIKSGF